ncbi:uncharacterized protein LOC113291366 [Papaver somniferum]|uniref:uncharacterized protein LOC113291366 n=1 Tax=Papaver somniferum TaxID=3469 RepID=UPI000E702088|nr:uncharacterized protein LOC113291366 [Papaver somniferum]
MHIVISEKVSNGLSPIEIDKVVTEPVVPNVLQEVMLSNDNTLNLVGTSNSFSILDPSMDYTHEVLFDQNKENFQNILRATQMKTKETEASNSGSRAHFQRRDVLSPAAINLFPKIAYLKKSARNVQVTVLSSSPQAISLDVSFSSMINFVVTFIYGDNCYITRNLLWNAIIAYAFLIQVHGFYLEISTPCFIRMTKWGGASVLPHNYQDLARCVQLSKIMDLQFSGCFFTWTNRRQDGTIVSSKIDRVMVNVEWIQQFQISKVEFLLPGISDHSPCIVSVAERRKHGPPPFRFYNFLFEEKDFMEVVRRGWNINVRGNPMIRLVHKLKSVKYEISRWKKLRFKNMSEQDDVADLVRPVTREEVVAALHSIGSSKAPGPNGFSSHFFKSCRTEKKNPSFVIDYRPISCCNVTYKCITKILSVRMKKILGGLISQNQSAFISGRSIQDNIVVAHELVRNYHRAKGTPRERTETRLSNLSILICAGYGNAECYPSKTSSDSDIWFSPKIIKDALDEFSSFSGLEINKQKTSLFCSAVDTTTKGQILQILDCTVGDLLSQELNSKFKRFLWAGLDLKKSYNPIKWCFACHSYEEGGLEIKDLENTNVAANLRHIWDLISGKDTIWNSWVKSNLIKDNDFWTMKIPQECSWCWRRILDHRELAKEHIGVLLGNGVSTNFLYEKWHSKGIFTNWVEPHILAKIGAADNSKVADFLSPEGWVFPDFMEDEVQDVVKEISKTEFNISESDQIFWNT